MGVEGSECARVHAVLPPRPTSARRARRLVREAAARRLPAERVGTAELLVSELITNAVVHAGTPVRLILSFPERDLLRVAVSDDSPHRPAPHRGSDTSATGRGLQLVAELADAWGVVPTADGKTVWFEVSGRGQGHHASVPPAGSDREAEEPGETVSVQLLDLPQDLHTRWQDDVRALLREYLLVMLEEDDADRPVREHAACSDAVALLADADVEPCDTGGESPRHARVTLAVPRASVPHFATLDQVLDRAVRRADLGELLTPATVPEARAFRRWVCQQVAEQAQGKPPTPWAGE